MSVLQIICLHGITLLLDWLRMLYWRWQMLSLSYWEIQTCCWLLKKEFVEEFQQSQIAFQRQTKKYMDEAYNKTKPKKYTNYLDANNLYGWAMCKPLPVSGFKWMSDFDNWKIIPCILEVDLEYPKELHDLHNDYPLAPERLMINKVENLITNDKEKYVIHHKNLTEYLDLGLGIKKIHRGITFKEEPWLEKYIKH